MKKRFLGGNKVKSKRNRFSLSILLIILFSISALGINFLILTDFFTPYVSASEAIEFTLFDQGTNYYRYLGNSSNDYPNQEYSEILSSLPGKIPVLMYHNIYTPTVAEKFPSIPTMLERYFVSSEQLREQLQTLHDANFRNISLDEYLALLDGDIGALRRLPPESKLYILTFDDATYGQFDTLGEDENGDIIIDSNCAVGIMLEFADKHPDFKLNAAFCIDFANTPFMDTDTVEKKLNTLLDYGFELVNHTATHAYLDNYINDQERLAYEVGEAMELFESYLGYRAASIDKLCYPGGRESRFLWEKLKEVEYEGKTYQFTAALDAEGYQALNPNDDDFNAFDISRIEINSDTFEPLVLNAHNLYQTPTLPEWEKFNEGDNYDIYSLLTNSSVSSIQ